MDKSRVNELVKKIGHGDQKAFDELYEGMKKILFAFLIPIVKNKEDVKDLLQEVFMTVIKKSKEKIFYFNCFGWIFTIAKCKAINFMKVRCREIALDTAAIQNLHEPANEEEDVVSKITLESAMAKLSDIEQQVVLLHYKEDYSFVNIAAMLKISVQKTKRIGYGAKEKLRKYLE